jgi:hypothetical protein
LIQDYSQRKKRMKSRRRPIGVAVAGSAWPGELDQGAAMDARHPMSTAYTMVVTTTHDTQFTSTARYR